MLGERPFKMEESVADALRETERSIEEGDKLKATETDKIKI